MRPLQEPSGAPLPLDAIDEKRLRRLVDVGPTLGAELDLESVLERLLTVAREVTGARYAAVGVLAPNRRELERFVTQGVDDDTRRTIGDLPRGHGVLGVLIRDPVPLRLHDVRDHPLSYGFPPGHPPMRTFLGTPVEINGQAWGNLYLTDKEGGEDFDGADEQAVQVLARWAGLAIEHARYHQETAAQRDEFAYTNRALEATTLISRALGAEVDLEATLELVVKRGRALIEARSVVILLAEGDELAITAMAGEVSSDVRGARLPLQGSASGRAFLTREVQRVPDFIKQIEMTSRRAGLGLSGEQFVSAGEHPALFVPMTYRGRAVGVLNAIGRTGEQGRFSDSEEQLILSFAASAATAVATAQSVEADRLRLSLRAMEAERSRWARELHDETLQGLGALRLLLSSARKSQDPEALDSAMQRAIEQVGGEISNLRALISDLRPASLDELGLGAALEGLVEQRRRQTSLTIDAHVWLRWEQGEVPDRLAPELETAIYRVVQESITNAVKHGDAKRLRVDVVEDDHHVVAVVEDDGVGFDGQPTGSGFGLTSMRERVALADGELYLSSEPGKGTVVQAKFPARRPSDAVDGANKLRLATDRDAG